MAPEGSLSQGTQNKICAKTSQKLAPKEASTYPFQFSLAALVEPKRAPSVLVREAHLLSLAQGKAAIAQVQRRKWKMVMLRFPCRIRCYFTLILISEQGSRRPESVPSISIRPQNNLPRFYFQYYRKGGMSILPYVFSLANDY
jgi:hypothetical protein